MNISLQVPEIRESSNSVPTSLSIDEQLSQDIKMIKKESPHVAKLFNEMHRQSLRALVIAFKNGDVFKKAS